MKLKGLRYSLVEFATNGIEVFIKLYLLIFYIEKVGMDGVMVGWALGIGTIFDAIMDPIIGNFTDNYKVKNGQRYKLMIPGVLVCSIFFWLLLNPPSHSYSYYGFAYLLIVSILFNFGYSLLVVPYTSSVSEIASNADERTRLIGWRSAIGNLGAYIGIGFPGIFLILNPENSYFYSSLAFICVLFLCFVISYQVIKSNNKINSQLEPSRLSWKALQLDIRNPFTLFFMGAFLIVNIGLTINSSLAIYFYRLRLKLTDSEVQIILGLFLIFVSIFVPFWIYVSKRFNKLKLSMCVLLLLGITNMFIYPLLPEKNIVMSVLFASLVGGFLVSVNFLLESYLTDYVTYLEVQTKKEKMGFYFGLFKMSGKIARGLALFFTGFLLDWSRVKNYTIDEKFDNLALSFGPIVGIFFIIGCGLILLMPKKFHINNL